MLPDAVRGVLSWRIEFDTVLGARSPILPCLVALSNQRDFRRLFSQGRRYRGQLLTLVVVAGGPADQVRVATICGRKVGNAVVRNRVKRRLREILRQLPWREGRSGDLGVIAHPQAATATYWELDEELRQAAQQAGLIGESTG